ncbi:4,5-DOPA dioxygenase extradiol [Chitinophaga agrisoli]|uniref:4,5-DOPA dioxygenase extradiol n=1 Tax=Chitinophaga agrisoli TaxID=2607653 RepID=A0A5B2VXM5_9BACT|nr:4,5-DOPA dioxygenase extradiol [Chitinophaga agrisoli]KAA2242779.1 4,5-DOPA dioxygenase extradiol [Chitinophaga agrisoli]
MQLQEFNKISEQYKTRHRKMPVLFIGHGHPINAVLDNDFTRSLTKLGKTLEKPNAILVVSAHWETVGTYVSVNPRPRTIYDFGRFDDRLFQISYEPAGQPEIARNVKKIVSMTDVMEDAGMGLDHGAWTVLKYIRPEADVPVFEMSVDYTRQPDFHFGLGAQLRSLRDRGVLIICSGNIVHNLRLTDWHNIDASPYEWNLEFDHFVKRRLDDRDFQPLINYFKIGASAMLSVPTNDHYLPMLYSLGLAGQDEPITHIYEGYQYAAMSMRCFQIG